MENLLETDFVSGILEIIIRNMINMTFLYGVLNKENKIYYYTEFFKWEIIF